MDLRDCIEKRASVRQFANDSIDVGDLREMVRLAGLAPSVNNSQPWRFIAITNQELLRSMSDAVHHRVAESLSDKDEEEKRAKSQVDWFSTFFADAPAAIAVAKCPYEAIVDHALKGTQLCHDDMNAIRGYPDVQSLGAAVQTLLLAAVDMGYGACWLSGPLIAREQLESILDVREPWRLAAMVAVGKPGAYIKQRARKPVEEIFELRK